MVQLTFCRVVANMNCKNLRQWHTWRRSNASVLRLHSELECNRRDFEILMLTHGLRERTRSIFTSLVCAHVNICGDYYKIITT
jgi:hypothetical protein